MWLPTSATWSCEGPGEFVKAQTVIKMLPNCSPMSHEQIETLISKIWWTMPEIFDHNHYCIVVYLGTNPKNHIFVYLLSSAIYRIAFALVKMCAGPLMLVYFVRRSIALRLTSCFIHLIRLLCLYWMSNRFNTQLLCSQGNVYGWPLVWPVLIQILWLCCLLKLS